MRVYLRFVCLFHMANDYILWRIFIGAEEHNNSNIIMIITTMADGDGNEMALVHFIVSDGGVW